MPPKSSDSQVDTMEGEMEEMKFELQQLPRLERTMKHLAQNFVKLLQTLEDTQKSVESLTIAQTKKKTVEEKPGHGQKLRHPWVNRGTLWISTLREFEMDNESNPSIWKGTTSLVSRGER